MNTGEQPRTGIELWAPLLLVVGKLNTRVTKLWRHLSYKNDRHKQIIWGQDASCEKTSGIHDNAPISFSLVA